VRTKALLPALAIAAGWLVAGSQWPSGTGGQCRVAAVPGEKAASIPDRTVVANWPKPLCADRELDMGSVRVFAEAPTALCCGGELPAVRRPAAKPPK
jgi:hypothetical protein